jgi:hypothetical protein
MVLHDPGCFLTLGMGVTAMKSIVTMVIEHSEPLPGVVCMNGAPDTSDELVSALLMRSTIMLLSASPLDDEQRLETLQSAAPGL